MIWVLLFFASLVVKDFKAAFVAQKIKAGVSMSPCGVVILPILALFFFDVLKQFCSILGFALNLLNQIN